MAKPRPATEPVYGVMMGVKHPGKKRPPSQLYPKEFTRFEVAAIGVMTIHWAYLEHMMLIRTLELAGEGKIDPPDDATAVSFERRLGAFRSTIKNAVKQTKKRDRWLVLATRISNVHNDRNMVTHGLWEWYPSRPTKLRLYTFRPPFQFDANFDHSRLATLCNRLGEINHELSNPPREGLRKLMPTGNYMSREFLIISTEQHPEKFGIMR
jgi:hypothetical protein